MTKEYSNKILLEKELHSCFIRLLEGEVIMFDIKSNMDVMLEDVQEMVNTAGELGNGKKFKNLIVAGPYSSMSTEATQFMKTPEAHLYTRSEAVVVSSLAQRIVGNFYLAIVTKRRPSRLFNSVEKALEWLNSQQ